uniref:Uncharacterized protein n=1 Tax=Haptolina brevifila TaxID=156173 RepID=A0A7S2IEJ7_9EUKA
MRPTRGAVSLPPCCEAASSFGGEGVAGGLRSIGPQPRVERQPISRSGSSSLTTREEVGTYVHMKTEAVLRSSTTLTLAVVCGGGGAPMGHALAPFVSLVPWRARRWRARVWS